MNPDLIQRALMHYCEHLEQREKDLVAEVHAMEGETEAISRFLWPNNDPVEWAEDNATKIIEELKRRGLGNGKLENENASHNRNGRSAGGFL